MNSQTLILGLLLMPSALNAMSCDTIKVNCVIQKITGPQDASLALIMFSEKFSKDVHGTVRAPNALALQCNIAQSPRITFNRAAGFITLKCAFKEAGMPNAINVSETIPFNDYCLEKPLSGNWHIKIETIMPPDSTNHLDR